MPFYNSFLQHFFLKGQAWKNIIWHGLLKKKKKNCCKQLALEIWGLTCEGCLQ